MPKIILRFKIKFTRIWFSINRIKAMEKKEQETPKKTKYNIKSKKVIKKNTQIKELKAQKEMEKLKKITHEK